MNKTISREGAKGAKSLRTAADARPIILWAVFVRGRRSIWINWSTIAYSRRGAEQRYCESWMPGVGAEHFAKGEIFLAKVEVRPLARPSEPSPRRGK